MALSGPSVCPRSLDPIYIVTNDIKWAKTSWTSSTLGNDAVYLFNLAEDPNETRDLAGDPQFADILQIMMERLQVDILYIVYIISLELFLLCYKQINL